MKPRASLMLILAAVASADVETCIDTEALDETPTVSLLQTEVHVNKVAPRASEKQALAGHRMNEKHHNEKKLETHNVKTGQLATAHLPQWFAVSILLLVFAAAIAGRPSAGSLALGTCLAEFLGTFFLVFSVGCNVLVGDKTWGVTSIACTLMVCIYALGSVSGANFNPAVSVALGLSNKLAWPEVAMYICVQLSAAITAGLCYGLMLGKTFNLAPTEPFSIWQAGVAELLYTFMLTFVVLNVACSKAHAGKEQFYGLAIAFTVVAGGYGAGSISGGCFNPAVALGVDSSSYAMGFGNCFAYWVFEIIGCALAALLFRVCRPGDFSLAPNPSPLLSKLVSEFLGTYMLVLTVGLNVLSQSDAAVFSIAAALMCMIFALGSVSGAHFNPAVTVAIACAGQGAVALVDVIGYICVQVLGGICAAFTYAWMMNGRTVTLAPKQGAQEALIGEFLFTFLLCFVVLSVATVKSSLTQYFGLAIGACVIAGGLAIGSLSGGSLNPAVSAGLAFTDSNLNAGPSVHFFTYTGAEFMGGIAAACVFQITHAREYQKS